MTIIQPFWFSNALAKEKNVKVNKLSNHINTDICIVGGGFTGLWTAIQLKLKQPTLNITIIDKEFESVSASLKQPFYRTFFRVTTPICLPAIFEISIYLFVNAMTTVSAVVFLYSADTYLASVTILNLDEAGEVAAAAALGMMIFYTNASVRIAYIVLTKKILIKTQAWRKKTN